MSPRHFLLPLLLVVSALAAEPEGGSDGTRGKKDDRYPDGNPAGEAPAAASKRFTVAPGLRVDLWASEPLLQDVVAFSFDEHGRAYVAETGRRRTSVPDIRRRMEWLLPDLALRSVEERVAFLQKAEPPEAQRVPDKERSDNNGDGLYDWRDMTVESERIRLVEDRDGDGTADHASVFAEGFNTLATGVGAGVLAHGGQVYYTCAPDLWKFPAGGESAKSREALATGFAVHVAYGGHDMHGVKMGPDGRLYWTVADCGARVTTKEGKVIEAPDFGAVYRSEPDGSKLELFAYGLRNPQSLAFNDVGDLFTGDNNADGGDRARWEHLVEGADYGWRIGWQFLPKLGLWNSERLWELDAGKTAYSQLPPVALIGHGPAGVAYYPGTGLPESYRGAFFYADFPGGVRAFKLQPGGASYTAENPDDVLANNKQSEMTNKLLWGLYPSDVQFGVDGGAYVLDWVEGWDKTGKGRIFRVHDPAVDQSAAVQETKALLAADFATKPEADLAALLGHVDFRVRQKAQFALVARGEAGLAALTGVARGGALPARFHAIWGLGQIGRRDAKAVPPLVALLRDGESEVAAQAAKCVAECVEPPPLASLLPLLQHPQPRVRFFAAQALGKLKSHEAIAPLLALARANADSDPYLRHAVACALANIGDVPALTLQVRDQSESVRAAVLLALRRMRRPEVAEFLNDWNPHLVLEAARAIHDEPVEALLPALVAMPAGAAPVPLAQRIVNAAYRVGNSPAAEALAKLASDPAATLTARLDALEALVQWTEPLGRDRLLGLYRPALPTRDGEAATRVAKTLGPKLLADPARDVQLAALNLIKRSKIAEAEPALLDLIRNERADGMLRAGALNALSALASPKLDEMLAFAGSQRDAALKAEAHRLAAKLSPAEALSQALATLEEGPVDEQQAALLLLASLKDKAAAKAIAKWMDRLAAGKVPAALQLELLEAAAPSADRDVAQKLAAWEKKRTADPASRFAECLEGGDPQAGRNIFYEKAEAACLRCHKVKGEGGDVGPDLAGIAAKHDRAYLLTSVVSPNAAIAPGYENVMLTLKDGNIVVGIASAETADEYVIAPLTGGEKQKVKKANVQERMKVPSAMPEGLAEVLGKRDLRNVIEFLATLK